MAMHDRYDNDVLRALQDISKNLAAINRMLQRFFDPYPCTPKELEQFINAEKGVINDGGV